MTTSGTYGAGVGQVTSLTGNEQIKVDNGGAAYVWATPGQIANLGGAGVTMDIIAAPISVTSGTTLSAGPLTGGLIIRTGPTSAFTDTTDTAVNILSALPSFVSGATFYTTIKNATAYVQTLSGGSGVTAPITNVIGPFEEGQYYGIVGGAATAPTITYVHLLTTAISLAPSIANPTAVALTTVGSGTILAAAFVAGGTARAGAQSGSAFTDTTDTAASIISANPGFIGKVGASLRYEYANLTNALATITGGSGTTVLQPGGSLTSTCLVPPNATAAFNLTYTAANTLTMACLGVSPANAATVNAITPVQVPATSAAVGPAIPLNVPVGASIQYLTADTVVAFTGATVSGSIGSTSGDASYMANVSIKGGGRVALVPSTAAGAAAFLSAPGGSGLVFTLSQGTPTATGSATIQGGYAY